MRPYFRGASVVAVPLRIGSGARNKILEAWASARPVVSTTMGAEGLAVAHGRDLLIADTAADFAAKVGELIEQPERQAALVAGGLASVRRHAPAEVSKRYRAAVAAVTAKVSAAPRGPMRICMDMRWMSPGSAGGIEQQARAFVGCLLEIDRVNRYTLILPPECTGDFDLRGRPNYRVVYRSSPAADLRRVGRAVGWRLGAALGGSSAHWSDRWALGDLHRLDADLAYSFPGYIHPDLWELRHVVSVPDIQHEFCPEFFSPEALAERSRLFDQTMERAEHICAMSAHTRQTLIERLGIEAGRISVTHLAASADFGPAAPGSEARTALFLEHRYGLKAGSYFFFPAHTWPHKNHVTVIRALARLRERYGVRMVLACTGGGARGARRARPPGSGARLAGAGALPGLCAARGYAAALSWCGGAGISLALRRFRHARRRGDGLRHAGDLRRCDEPARDRGGRGALPSPARRRALGRCDAPHRRGRRAPPAPHRARLRAATPLLVAATCARDARGICGGVPRPGPADRSGGAAKPRSRSISDAASKPTSGLSRPTGIARRDADEGVLLRNGPAAGWRQVLQAKRGWPGLARMRIGIIGCGLIGQKRAQAALASGHRVTHAADIETSRAQKRF